jgi:hypothetical protein
MPRPVAVRSVQTTLLIVILTVPWSLGGPNYILCHECTKLVLHYIELLQQSFANNIQHQFRSDEQKRPTRFDRPVLP